MDITQTISVLLRRKKYVRRLLIDCTKAFDSVDHAILIRKLAEYGLEQNVIDWIVSFLSDRTQYTKVDTNISGTKAISLSVVQDSGVGPCLFIILVIDLRPTGSTNHMVKYADDTSLSVPEKCSVSLEDEFIHAQIDQHIINF